ncbi:beta-galactosidase [Saccharicrinis aurantiacus]|uniref:beta-galactosidase n=1 Tax=Saccharicrinis aurantiacus TaxID=1849719 RepID=UPI000950196A|nr:beta-galactosidase [Saccharicrinis aurantiacus]
MNYMKVSLFLLIGILAFGFTTLAQNLEQDAKQKITKLEKLIKKAEKKKIDVQKEKMTVRTAELFLKYAKWDEAHPEENIELFKQTSIYEDSAAQCAKMIPDFERSEVNIMLDEATAYIEKLISGKVKRTPSPLVDWSKAHVEGDQITFNNRPVFLADYTWKPRTPELMEYHGQQDGYFLMPPHVVKADGTIQPRVMKELNAKPDGQLGFIFYNHKNSPKWAAKKYGEGFVMREDTYTAYDIDNPGAREMYGYIIDATVPIMKGKKYTELGYMLCNEPHFYTTRTDKKLDWASGPVSEYTFAKFRKYLSEKHASIEDLNALWESNFTSFDDVTIDIPINIKKQGTPMWFDWVSFNQERVTDWYAWMKGRIQQHDPNAKVHLKIMPNLWTENKRGHGINLEDLTMLSGIIGNDAGAAHSQMWGKPGEWMEHYAFEWREMAMSFDFMKSVSPNKISYNTEAHYLSTVRSRDLYLQPEYARATQWLATTQGLDVSQIWYWPRKEDGSVSVKAGKGYAGSNMQQPRIVNEVHSTVIDLNSFSEEIMAMQRQAKPIRIFQSETSAINNGKYMDKVFSVYESLFFNGVPLGFATEKIIKNQDNKSWECILIQSAARVTEAEIDALQSYIDNGGVIISDWASLKYNQYGQLHTKKLKGKGRLIRVNSVKEMADKAMDLVEEKGFAPEVAITETNEQGIKTCTWKCVKNAKGNNVLSIINVGKTDATLNITLKNAKKGTKCFNLIDGIDASTTPTLKPNELYFVEVLDK